MNFRMIEGLRRKIVTDLQERLQRHVAIAQVVLSPRETCLLILQVTADMMAIGVLVPLQIRRKDTDPSELFDDLADQLRRLVAEGKGTYLRALLRHERAEERQA